MANVIHILRSSRLSLAACGCAALAALAGCGSASGTGPASAPNATAAPAASSSTTPAPSASASPGTMFGTANVPGLGTAVVDGHGRTVYVLTSGGTKNVPCDDASGCTKVWPDLPLPAGTPAPTAGAGVQSSLLSTMKLSDGESYPTYNGYLMYEYVGDSGPGQAHGQGIQSFGGTWYAISAEGTLVGQAGAAGSSSSSTMPSSSSPGSVSGY